MFRDIQGYWCIFSRTHRCATWGRGEASPVFFENRIKVSWFWGKKAWLFRSLGKIFHSKCTFKEYLGEKFQKYFPARPLFVVLLRWFLVFLTCFWNVYWSALVPQHSPNPLYWKITLFFLQNAPPKCLTVFWIRPYLDNCSVICTVTLCYVEQQTHPEFWYIRYCFFRYMPAY